MAGLSQQEMNLLHVVQDDFPLTRQPFRDIGRRAGLTEKETLVLLQKLKSENIVREISILLDSKKTGYKSTLVALNADEWEMETVIPRINAHPGVSHNYLRQGFYNVWFTLTIPAKRVFIKEIISLFGSKSLSYLILSSLQTFKIGVRFAIGEHKKNIYRKTMRIRNDVTRELSSFEKEILRKLQVEFPLDPDPWKILSEHCRVNPDELVKMISDWKREGIIKRIAAFIRHRNVGYTANGMVCFNVPEQNINESGKIVSQYQEVSHCYQRQAFREWPYNLYAMVHCKEQADCNTIISNIANKIDCKDYQVLYSIKELKKERIRYFMEEK